MRPNWPKLARCKSCDLENLSKSQKQLRLFGVSLLHIQSAASLYN